MNLFMYKVRFPLEKAEWTKNENPENNGLQLRWLERAPDKREVDGSSPSRPTNTERNLGDEP